MQSQELKTHQIRKDEKKRQTTLSFLKCMKCQGSVTSVCLFLIWWQSSDTAIVMVSVRFRVLSGRTFFCPRDYVSVVFGSQYSCLVWFCLHVWIRTFMLCMSVFCCERTGWAFTRLCERAFSRSLGPYALLSTCVCVFCVARGSCFHQPPAF